MQTIWLFVSRLSSYHGMNSQIALLASVNSVNPRLFRPNNRCNDIMVLVITHAICVIKYVSVSVISTNVQWISEIGFKNADTPLRSERITYARSFFFTIWCPDCICPSTLVPRMPSVQRRAQRFQRTD